MSWTPGFISVQVLGKRKHLEGYKNFPKALKEELKEVLNHWTFLMYDEVVSNIETRFSGRPKKPSSRGSERRLKDSVRTEIIDEGTLIEGRVYIAGIPYAKIQEAGGVIGGHLILPQQSKVLAFMAASGHKAFALHALHPGSVIMPKHFMRDARLAINEIITDGLRYRLKKRVMKKARNEAGNG